MGFAETFKALSDPVRRDILSLLKVKRGCIQVVRYRFGTDIRIITVKLTAVISVRRELRTPELVIIIIGGIIFPELLHSLCKNLLISLETHISYEAALFSSKQITSSSDIKVLHGYIEAAAQI